ncbi:hypothetical protein [Gloeocapsopsis sp. IPPAS B-1203]|uniref:hypothetical protein n=1 Tax=Gloeocapsopsis sp. IPPAS B-1203 TaxID=2049454 RepID=UPI0011808111|nr:hypothetical protein [Gloeocapsopsis sp. IPPAS B-1203]
MLQAQLEETPTTIPAPDASTTPPGTGASPTPEGVTTPGSDDTTVPTPDGSTIPDTGTTPGGVTTPEGVTTPGSDDTTAPTPDSSTNPTPDDSAITNPAGTSETSACEPIPTASPSGGATREIIQAQQACNQAL